MHTNYHWSYISYELTTQHALIGQQMWKKFDCIIGSSSSVLWEHKPCGDELIKLHLHTPCMLYTLGNTPPPALHCISTVHCHESRVQNQCHTEFKMVTVTDSVVNVTWICYGDGKNGTVGVRWKLQLGWCYACAAHYFQFSVLNVAHHISLCKHVSSKNISSLIWQQSCNLHKKGFWATSWHSSKQRNRITYLLHTV